MSTTEDPKPIAEVASLCLVTEIRELFPNAVVVNNAYTDAATRNPVPETVKPNTHRVLSAKTRICLNCLNRGVGIAPRIYFTAIAPAISELITYLNAYVEARRVVIVAGVWVDKDVDFLDYFAWIEITVDAEPT